MPGRLRTASKPSSLSIFEASYFSTEAGAFLLVTSAIISLVFGINIRFLKPFYGQSLKRKYDRKNDAQTQLLFGQKTAKKHNKLWLFLLFIPHIGVSDTLNGPVFGLTILPALGSQNQG
jgi:hypothetical protein